MITAIWALQHRYFHDHDDFSRAVVAPARDGAPLELGVLGFDSDDPVIIHALPLRAKFYRFLRRRR
jgi:hypothetical protein